MILCLLAVSSLVSGVPRANFVECEACHLVIAGLQDYAKDPNLYTGVVEAVLNLCVDVSGEQEVVCKGLIDEFEDIAIDIFTQKFIDPERLCLELEYCSTPTYVEEDFDAYVANVMKGKPSGPGPVPTGKSSYTFAHLSDIHLDFYYTPGSESECDLPLCCRTGTGTGNNSAGYWGGLVCDIPVRTLEAALQQLSTLSPEFIIVTGDYPPHDVWNQSVNYNLEYQRVVSSAFQKYFQNSNTIVYPIYGNHGCYPINQYLYGPKQYMPTPFCQDWAWTVTSSPAVLSSLQSNAGYSLLHKNTNLRLIALDTNTGNSGNYYLFINSTDPQGQLGWLYQQLLKAEAAKEVVYIFGHIPPGDVDCLSVWSNHFNAIVDRFEYTIQGLFFGHTHNDEFHINRGVYSNLPLKVQWIAPSTTTYTYKNPSFRLFQADSDTKILTDYTQYRLNLTNANLYPDVTPLWDAAYSFKQYYGINDITVKNVYNLALKIGNSEQLATSYLYNFYTAVNAPSECDIRCQSELSCELTYGVLDDILNCQGYDKDWIYKLLEELFGVWVYKYD
jgi:sphingomyelin phosphodiesterase